MDPFANLYLGNYHGSVNDPEYFPPEVFEHGVWRPVAHFSAGEDGSDVEILEMRMPSPFFRVRIWGDHPLSPAWQLDTGSSMGALAFAIARAIASGTLTLEVNNG